MAGIERLRLWRIVRLTVGRKLYYPVDVFVCHLEGRELPHELARIGAQFVVELNGGWHDYESYPVRDITISCTEKVAHYLRTLPLHHSQREDAYREGPDARIIFHYHISPSPDFIGDLKKWGDGIKIKEGI